MIINLEISFYFSPEKAKQRNRMFAQLGRQRKIHAMLQDSQQKGKVMLPNILIFTSGEKQFSFLPEENCRKQIRDHDSIIGKIFIWMCTQMGCIIICNWMTERLMVTTRKSTFFFPFNAVALLTCFVDLTKHTE